MDTELNQILIALEPARLKAKHALVDAIQGDNYYLAEDRLKVMKKLQNVRQTISSLLTPTPVD